MEIVFAVDHIMTDDIVYYLDHVVPTERNSNTHRLLQ